MLTHRQAQKIETHNTSSVACEAQRSSGGGRLLRSERKCFAGYLLPGGAFIPYSLLWLCLLLNGERAEERDQDGKMPAFPWRNNKIVLRRRAELRNAGEILVLLYLENTIPIKEIQPIESVKRDHFYYELRAAMVVQHPLPHLSLSVAWV